MMSLTSQLDGADGALAAEEATADASTIGIEHGDADALDIEPGVLEGLALGLHGAVATTSPDEVQKLEVATQQERLHAAQLGLHTAVVVTPMESEELY